MKLKERLKTPPCKIGLNSLCCKICLMGPCIVTKDRLGACGANQDLITSRNILRFVAGGAAAHSGHAFHMLNYLNKTYPTNYIKKKAPKELYKLWNKLNIVPKVKLEHFKDISEALHTSTMGVNADYQDVMKWCMKLGIVDGYFGLYLSTELEDERYGKPKIKTGELNLGVIKNNKVNIAVHGHEPMLANAIVKEAKKHKDVNIIGVCCTGASILNRYGIPLAADFILQEDVIATGAIEAMVVDVQCIMPSISDLIECYHTKLITTNDIARMPNAIHLPLKHNATKVAKQIIKIAKENKKHRKRIKIPKIKTKVKVGFTPDNILKELNKQLKTKKGIIGVVGCTNPRVTEDWVKAYKKLSKDYIILTTGCIAFKLGEKGLLDGKHFFHMGSCVHNARIAETFKRLSELNKKSIKDMPFLISCPMPITEKAIAIGFFFAALGTDVHFGYPFMIKANSNITNFLSTVLKKEFHSNVFLETDPKKLTSSLSTS